MSLYFLLVAVSLLIAVAESGFSHGNNPLGGAGELSSMKPRCAYDRHGNKHVPCPTPDIINPSNWPCVKMADLCNGFNDCPNKEDEEVMYCFYHRFRANEINKLRQSLEQIKG